jgi:hypothetical protein
MSGNIISALVAAFTHYAAPAALPTHPTFEPAGTAVLSLSSHTVTLPDGERLEAHSGLGACRDTTDCVSRHMVGAAPPNLYALTPRGVFYGAYALRLEPIGSGPMYGRAGLLTHPFLHGPDGDTNGCVAFRNYPRFLAAFRSGQVRQLQVTS